MNDKKLYRRVQALQQEGKHQKVISLLDGYPSLTPRLNWALASSCLAEAYGPAGRDALNLGFMAMEALDAMPEEEQHSAQWSAAMGAALTCAGQGHDAMQYLQEAERLAKEPPGDSELLDIVRNLTEQASGQEETPWWLERVRRAWSAFLSREEEIRSLLDEDTPQSRDQACAAAAEAAGTVLGIPCYVEKTGGRCRLLLSTECSLTGTYGSIFFRDSAPPELPPCWDVTVGFPPDEERPEELRCCPVEAGSLLMRLDLPDGSQDSARLAVLDTRTPPPPWDERFTSAVADTLAGFLGDIPAMRMLRFAPLFDGTGMDPEDGFCPPDRLREQATSLGMDLSPDPDTFLDSLRIRYPDTDTPAGRQFRQDILSGWTSFPELHAEYIAQFTRYAWELHDTGIMPCFLSISASRFPLENRAAVMEQTLSRCCAYLEKNAGPEHFRVIGQAVGRYHCYLDMLCWDPGPVLEAADEFIQEEDLGESGIYSFYLQ